MKQAETSTATADTTSTLIPDTTSALIPNIPSIAVGKSSHHLGGHRFHPPTAGKQKPHM